MKSFNYSRLIAYNHLRIFSSLLLLIILPYLTACKNSVVEISDNVIEISEVYQYQEPVETGDGWKTTSLEEVGLTAESIHNLMDDLQNNTDHLYHGILIIKNGFLVFEEYFNGNDIDIFNNLDPVYTEFNRDQLHFQASVTKSITSLCFGIAIDQGLIGDVEDKLFSYFPDHQDLNSGNKNEISLAHTLAMCSGLAWDESTYFFSDPRSDTYQVINGNDPVRFILNLPLISTPGTSFHYNSGTTNLLGEIIRETSGKDLLVFAEEYLFDPLNIDQSVWMHFLGNPEVIFASGGLYLRPRDMAKIGQLCLQRGVWNKQQIVSEEWIDASTTESISLPQWMNDSYHADSYGYQWWLESYRSGTVRAYSARGWGNQYIVVVPDLEMVVVFTAGAYFVDQFATPYQYYNILEDYILSGLN